MPKRLMSPTISALYEIHRHQILLDASRREDDQIFPAAYIYALDHRLSPILHSEWIDRDDPFEAAYRPNTTLVNYIHKHLKDVYSLKAGNFRSFNQLEKSLGGLKYRYSLRVALRYCFQSGEFDQEFYNAVLKEGDHPEEALSITRPFSVKDIQLV
ncbi:hypothetical protein [Rubritalea sp.]|uniref:hypothetical protein n=1 Tax=Rubritalea sp. TaxID=2109375 RepID=UPI003EF3165F